MEASTLKEPNGSVVALALVALALVLLPIFYAASVGPVIWLADRGLIAAEPGSAVNAVYWPLTSAANHSVTAQSVLEWYLGLFHTPPEPPGLQGGLAAHDHRRPNTFPA